MALRGALAVAFGVIALTNPGAAAGAFVIVFAVYAFVDGFIDFTTAARMGRAGRRWGWYLFEGLVSVALGVIALAYPSITLLVLILLVALRAIMLGVLEIFAAFTWEGHESRWLLGLTGVLSLGLGVLLLVSPAAGGLAIIFTIGVYAIVFGLALVAFGLSMLIRRGGERPVPGPTVPAT